MRENAMRRRAFLKAIASSLAAVAIGVRLTVGDTVAPESLDEINSRNQVEDLHFAIEEIMSRNDFQPNRVYVTPEQFDLLRSVGTDPDGAFGVKVHRLNPG